jgi:hypothetical protein
MPTTCELVKEDGSRESRTHNIAVVLSEVYAKKKPDQVEVRIQPLRFEIRKRLGIVLADGEPSLGDLRAHGDACGGHGLHLDMVTRNRTKFILLNEKNRNICEKRLESAAPGEFTF